MRVLELLEKRLFDFSHLWRVSDYFWGRFFSPILAVPIVFASKFLYSVSIDSFYLLQIIVFLIFMISSFIGFKNMPIERYEKILLPNVFGFMIALFIIQTGFFNTIFAFFSFSIFSFFLKYYFQKRRFIERVFGLTSEESPFFEKFLLTFSTSFFSGVFSGLLFYFFRILTT